MDTFNLIASACSIVGLFVSLFTATKVLRLSNSNNKNKGQINQGDGEQKVATDHSAIGNAKVIHNDYRNANIQGEIDQLPELMETAYPIYADNFDRYSNGISKNSCELVEIGKKDVILFSVDFSNVISKPDAVRFVGYSFKSLPMKDWRSFVENNFVFSFDYKNCGTVKEVWLEFTNFVLNKKIYKKQIFLSNETKKFEMCLGNFRAVIEDWKSVDEICFVFFPEDCIGQQGSVVITNMTVKSV